MNRLSAILTVFALLAATLSPVLAEDCFGSPARAASCCCGPSGCPADAGALEAAPMSCCADRSPQRVPLPTPRQELSLQDPLPLPAPDPASADLAPRVAPTFERDAGPCVRFSSRPLFTLHAAFLI